MFFNIRQCYQVKLDHSKIRKMHFWMIQSAKNEVFGHFLEFGLLVRLDIAYFDGTKCFLTFGNDTRWWRIIQKSQKCIFEGSKEPKKEVFDHFLGFGLLDRLDIAYCDSTKCFPTLEMLPGHEGSFKDRKNAFLNDPKAQKRGFWLFSGVWSVGSTWYCILW